MFTSKVSTRFKSEANMRKRLLMRGALVLTGICAISACLGSGTSFYAGSECVTVDTNCNSNYQLAPGSWPFQSCTPSDGIDRHGDPWEGFCASGPACNTCTSNGVVNASVCVATWEISNNYTNCQPLQASYDCGDILNSHCYFDSGTQACACNPNGVDHNVPCTFQGCWVLTT